MRGFTRALGVSCAHCHVGEEDEPLTTYDFASDENPNKERAREMLRMLQAIGAHLEKISPSGDQRVNVWCHTCHRGRPRPMTLAEELAEVYRAQGIEAALAHYSTLKERFLEAGSYDFREGALNAFGYQLLGVDAPRAAVEVFRLNAELFPESANVWDSLAESLDRAGDAAGAIRGYQKSLAIDPDNENAREQLRRLSTRGGEHRDGPGADTDRGPGDVADPAAFRK
jgi:tetratricopeptide (TPR) repeat protein